MAKKVVVELTVAEASALLDAIGNSLYSPEDAEALFVNKKSRDAAYRGRDKIQAAFNGAKSEGK